MQVSARPRRSFPGCAPVLRQGNKPERGRGKWLPVRGPASAGEAGAAAEAWGPAAGAWDPAVRGRASWRHLDEASAGGWKEGLLVGSWGPGQEGLAGKGDLELRKGAPGGGLQMEIPRRCRLLIVGEGLKEAGAPKAALVS